MKTKLLTKTLLAAVVSLAVGTITAAPYEIIDLGKIEGGTNSFAYGINDAGEVVGFGDGPLITNTDGTQSREFTSHALNFLSTGVLDLGVLDSGSFSHAIAINNTGIIIGTSNEIIENVDENGVVSQESTNYLVQFLNGSVMKLPLTDLTQTEGVSINSNGILVGVGNIDLSTEDDFPAVPRGFIYDLNSQSLISTITPLTDLNNRSSFALSINDNGDIVGYSQKEVDNELRLWAFHTTVDEPTVINELPNTDTALTIARDINNNGLIVGNTQFKDSRGRTAGFYYDMNNDAELALIPFFSDEFDNAIANAVNDNGQIVGQALVTAPSTGINNGFLFENNELKNLNDLIACDSGWVIDNATNINNNGEIIGYGLRTELVNGETINEIRAFKLIPTGGSIEICEDDNNDSSNESSGGSWGPLGLLLLMVYGIRRKFI